jgi:hypothetical protein
MKKLILLALPLALTPVGCTTLALRHETVNQSETVSDYRYRAALHCLAMVAAQPDTLPSYALLSNGVAAVTQTGIASPMLGWAGAPEVFSSVSLGFTATHSPMLNWTVSPVTDYTQLAALRAACQWVLFGPENLAPDSLAILVDPEHPGLKEWPPKPHFGVAHRLSSLPHDWLHRGRRCDVPVGACFKAHCGDMWVWIMPDGLEGLAAFTLVLQDIATLLVVPPDTTVPQNLAPPLLVTLWLVDNTLPKPEPVIINIRKIGNDVIYPSEVEVHVGQSVIWQNTDPNDSHSATSTKRKGLFDTDLIPPGAKSKPIAFDDSMFANAEGYHGNMAESLVDIEYSDKANPAIKAKIKLIYAPFTGVYSPAKIFRVDRVVKPEFKENIEAELLARTRNAKNPTGVVEISWEQWMAWTAPYQGQRTGVKPGAAQGTPIIQPIRTVPASTILTSPAFNQTRPPVDPKSKKGALDQE